MLTVVDLRSKLLDDDLDPFDEIIIKDKNGKVLHDVSIVVKKRETKELGILI